MMVSALRVGHSMIASLGAVAQESPEPIGGEMRKCFEEQNYGVDLRTALVNLTERAPIQDFRIFVAAVLIQKESGGNLAEVLEKVAQTTRERFRLKKQVSVHTAQARMTGWVLSLLPVALGLGMYFVNPDGMSVLWKHPLGLKMLYDSHRHGYCRGPHHPEDRADSRLRPSPMQLVLFSFLAAFVLLSSFGVLLFYRHTSVRRLSQVVSRAADASLLRSIAPTSGSRIEKLVKPFQKVVPRSPADVSTVQKRLVAAGYREQSYVNIFYSSKVLVPCALCLLATVTQVYAYAPLFVYALAAGLGFSGPGSLAEQSSFRQTTEVASGPSGSSGPYGDLRGGGAQHRQGDHANRGGAAHQPAGNRR